jgi:hypothetical protein
MELTGCQERMELQGLLGNLEQTEHLGNLDQIKHKQETRDLRALLDLLVHLEWMELMGKAALMEHKDHRVTWVWMDHRVMLG